MSLYKLFLISLLFINEVFAVQHPNGFTTFKECAEQENPAIELLTEADSKQFVLMLENGAVINEGGIITRDGKVLKDTETHLEDQHRLLALRGQWNLAEEESTYFNGHLAVISSPGQENWYHWLFQVLPRLKILSDSNVKYDKIYIDNLKYSWQRESLSIILDILHIPTDRLFLKDGDAIIQAANLIVPSIPHIPSKFPHFPQWLKTFIRNSFLKADVSPLQPEKIYISRAKASTRRILNETAMLQFLREKGFEIVCLEDLPIRKQAELFHSAKIIVGPHGSGFANLIFSTPETRVIEIDHRLPGEEQRSYYKRLSEHMGCHYDPFYVGLANEDELDNDLYIDIPAFEEFLEKTNVQRSPS